VNPVPLPWRRETGPARHDVLDLAERLAALTRAGLAPQRAWQVLAGDGPVGGIARDVCGMLAVGGRAGDGLRRAAGSGGGADALRWMAVAADLADRVGGPVAGVLDGLADGLRAELAAADEQDVALAGARTSAAVVSVLPPAGLVLGSLAGVDVWGAAVGTTAGRVALLAGCLLWGAGRWWAAWLVKRAAGAGG
jgi:tight adherence protein B